MKRLFTSESVTEGHPDKLCDQISDAILDAIMEQDPNGRVAAETTAATGYAMVMGEITTDCYIDIPNIIRGVICDVGYTKSEYGFDGNTCAVLTTIHEQSSDIALGVNKALECREETSCEIYDSIGAGDQGIMFGFACTETPELMPDGKTQVTVEYEDSKVVRVDTVLISSQHDPDISMAQMKKDIIEFVVKPVIPAELLDDATKYYVNPTGRFVIGSPNGDSGLTGRKIIVDTYGGYSRHGGGAFSGKDPTKVDRSATYAARYVAKNIVAAGLADKCELELAYAIGVAHPLSIFVDTFGTGKLTEDELTELVRKHFDLRPAAIIEALDLRRPIYRQVAAYGHFGRTDIDIPWERTDKAEILRKEAGL